MFLETIETPGLAHLSYLIGDEAAGVAAVIDPRRDVGTYLELARRRGVRIIHVLETHVHADYVSGARELAALAGTLPGVGAGGEYGFPHRSLCEGEVLEVGGVRLRVLHTPGHTPEHVCYVVGGGKGAGPEWGVFTGDTLFAGDVGRPDLLGDGSEGALARSLYRSLQGKLLPLGDGIEVLPAHGKGSPCGGSIGHRLTTTLGYERLHNEKLAAGSEEEFAALVLGSLPPAPTYYPRVKGYNSAGPGPLGELRPLVPLEPAEFARLAAEPGAVVVDAREIEAFAAAHVPEAVSLALRAEFPIWAGWTLPPEARLLLVAEGEAGAHEARTHLVRVGLENVGGYLRRGMPGWLEAGLPFARLGLMGVGELWRSVLREPGLLQVLDVRRPDEWAGGFVPTARHVHGPELPERLGELDRDRPLAVYCGTGYRSSLAASLLLRAGFAQVLNVPGGITAWRAAGYPLEGEPAAT